MNDERTSDIMNRISRILPMTAFATALLVTNSRSLAADPPAGAVIFDMDTIHHQPTVAGPEKTPIGTVELVPGKFGSACRFQFKEDARGGFFTAGVRPDDGWKQAAGISFWVKGDGSSSWGGLEMIDSSNYALRYGYCFPVDSTEWQKIIVPWCDLIPELPAGAPVGSEGGYAPAGFGNLWFGKWYYWRDYPAHSFTIDQITLEPQIDVDTTDYTPAVAGTPKTLARLKAGEPVVIVTMGDSLSDKRHWANREVLWSELVVKQLGQQFGSKVKLVNPAIGGTQLSQNLVLMPRWLKECPQPDLVTVCFGYNDWDGGMRRERFTQMLQLGVDRIRRMTHGKSEILLVTTCPAYGRWETMNELAEAVRIVAEEKRTGLADITTAFHQAGTDEETQLALYCSDRTHLAPRGHTVVAETVVESIVK